MALMPRFIPSDIELSILRCESVFICSNIESQDHRFKLLVSILPPSLAQDLQYLISDPPSNNPYDSLREALMVRHFASENELVEKLSQG
jgi:hypothetical protein